MVLMCIHVWGCKLKTDKTKCVKGRYGQERLTALIRLAFHNDCSVKKNKKNKKNQKKSDILF